MDISQALSYLLLHSLIIVFLGPTLISIHFFIQLSFSSSHFHPSQPTTSNNSVTGSTTTSLFNSSLDPPTFRRTPHISIFKLLFVRFLSSLLCISMGACCMCGDWCGVLYGDCVGVVYVVVELVVYAWRSEIGYGM